eukprot:TRINITY_DN2479_c0_g1_i1.p1 TRINITY_DN2479_c0_g1~~TRINITY_DN2479_c0_g1_i1.p1  ORF type:complete len:447 (+),score=109.46 TRINITY_DN2479_c0_g1_i1:56-1396(+)
MVVQKRSKEENDREYHLEPKESVSNENNEKDSEEKKGHEKKHGLYEQRSSLLSSDSSSTQGYRGLINLGIILIVLSNLRLVILNFNKYGILLQPEKIYISEWYRWPGVIIFLFLNIFILVSFLLEHLAVKKTFEERTIIMFQIINISLLVLIPSSLVWIFRPNPLSGILVMIFMSVYMMKLTSYAHINYNLRQEAKKGVQNGFPNNLTYKNMYYFMIVPATVYQIRYPRVDRVRKGWLLRRIVETAFFTMLIVVIVTQYITPLVNNSIAPLDSSNYIRIIERLLKLSVPNLFVWLLGFYVFFHLFLNIVAELTRFGDREFYKDWWNSTTLGYFWRNWNMPVHNWMVAHIYMPAVHRGYSKTQSSFICFFVSAVFHELIVGAPFRMVKMWAFTGMMAQIPFIYLTERFRGKQIGNIFFWFSIVLGQPFCVLMIYRDWYQQQVLAGVF